MEAFKDWNFWLTLVTIIVAIVALIQSSKHTKLSNKQHLFDKRVETYIIVTGIIDLYAQNNHLLDKKTDGPMFTNDFIFIFLTNNTYMEEVGPAIKNTLNNPEHKILLSKLESLKEISLKVRFLFSKEEADILSDFITKYHNLLFKMYQYQIVIKSMNDRNSESKITVDQASELTNEKEQRKELHLSILEIKQSYDLLKQGNVEKKIYNQIKLS